MNRFVHVGAACCVALAAVMPRAFAAGYNANWSGKIVSLSAYSYSDQVFFSLDTMPTLPSGTCSNSSFAFTASDSSGSDAESRNRMYATLLAAYLSGQSVSIGYDNSGASCTDGVITSFRVGF